MPEAKISCWVCHGKGQGGWNGAYEECSPCGGTGKVPDTPSYWDPMSRRRRDYEKAQREEWARRRAEPNGD